MRARGRIGRRRLGLSPRTQVDGRHPRFLVPVDQLCGAPIELVRDIEQMLGELVRRHARQQRTADAQVDVGTLLIRNQRVGRLLDPVVQKSAGTLLVEDDPGADGFPEGSVHRFLCCPVNQGHGGGRGDIAQAGELFQGFLGGGRKPSQLPGHEIHHVVSVALGTDAVDVPSPGPRNRVECQQPFFGQRDKELDREERISAGLLLHQLR